MKSFAIISTFLAGALAAPANILSARQTTGRQLTEVAFRVSNLEDPAAPKSSETTITINGGEIVFDTSSDLVGACPTCLNTGGLIFATRIDILTPLEAVHCKLYNDEKHVIGEFNNLFQGFDFDGIENHPELVNKAVLADKYSFLCYYV
jgi:hypothetical protein